MNAEKQVLVRRVVGLATAAACVAALLLLPLTERAVEANGPAGVSVEPTPLPLIVVQPAPTPAPVVGPRLHPEPIEHTSVLLPVVILHELLSPPPLSAQEANAAADAVREAEEADGRGITTGTSAIASGLTLFAPQSALQVTYLAVQGSAGYAQPGAVQRAAAAPVAYAPAAMTSAAQGGTPLQPVQPPAAANAVAPRTIQSPAQLGLPTPLPTFVAAPAVGIRDPTAPIVVQGQGQIPVVSALAAQAPAPAAGQYTYAPQASAVASAPTPAGAHEVPVIVVEPGGAAVPIGVPVPGVADIACNNFNQASRWASARDSLPTDMWSDWYAGWGPYAVDNGLYQAKNVTFSLESAVGPGSNAGPNEHSAKIASNQPYAAGFGSPLFGVPPGALVTVSVNYLIFDHNDHGYDYDWASLGIKADAYSDEARYVNGYARGEWATLMNSVVAGKDGRVMVLIQAESPGALNSNIYFDNVRIWIDGAPVVDCTG